MHTVCALWVCTWNKRIGTQRRISLDKWQLERQQQQKFWPVDFWMTAASTSVLKSKPREQPPKLHLADVAMQTGGNSGRRGRFNGRWFSRATVVSVRCDAALMVSQSPGITANAALSAAFTCLTLIVHAARFALQPTDCIMRRQSLKYLPPLALVVVAT